MIRLHPITLLLILFSSTFVHAQTAKPIGVGRPMVWRDPGELTPKKVYQGIGGTRPNPASRLPMPPYSQAKPDVKLNSVSPKVKTKDSRSITWTVKFNLKVDGEVHAEIAATRLAWALGFGCDEDYYVAAGKFDGFKGSKKFGKAAGNIAEDGTFEEARFKRHNKDASNIHDAGGEDQLWDENRNPGVPAEQMGGLLIFDVLINNFDAQPKNCKVLRVTGPQGPEDWYIVSDMGGSFGAGKSKWNIKAYQAEKSFVKSVDATMVHVNYFTTNKRMAAVHQNVPISYARWFRTQLMKLTDDEIIAAFNAGFASSELDKAYAAGDMATVKKLTPSIVTEFAAKLRERIEEFKTKVPAAP